MPKTISKVAVFHGADRPLELVTVEVPELTSQQLLVRNELTTLCRSDLSTYCGKRKELTPTILGHEIIGRVAAFGPDAPRCDLRGSELRIGDRVTWAIFASDPASEMAQRGMPQKGADRFKYGHERFTDQCTLHGGLSEYTILRRHTPIIKIDERVPVVDAALVNCAVATVAGALRLAGDIGGRRVLVSGVGMLGVFACAMARHSGASHVAAIDVHTPRLQIAEVFGAQTTVAVPRSADAKSMHLAEKLQGMDVVLEFSGVPWAMEKTIETLGIGGVAVWVGAVSAVGSVSIDGERVVRNLLSIRGLHNYNSEDFLRAVEFIETHHTLYPFHDLIHAPFTLDQVNEAFDYALNKEAHRVGVQL